MAIASAPDSLHIGIMSFSDVPSRWSGWTIALASSASAVGILLLEELVFHFWSGCCDLGPPDLGWIVVALPPILAYSGILIFLTVAVQQGLTRIRTVLWWLAPAVVSLVSIWILNNELGPGRYLAVDNLLDGSVRVHGYLVGMPEDAFRLTAATNAAMWAVMLYRWFRKA